MGRKLGVANVLEGSIRRDGGNVRITAELIKTEDGFQLWSQTYDRELRDIFAVQDEIAQSATEALQVKLLGGNGHPFDSNVQSTNPEAYQAYLQAEYFRARGQSKEDLSKRRSPMLTKRSSWIKNMRRRGPCERPLGHPRRRSISSIREKDFEQPVTMRSARSSSTLTPPRRIWR